MVYVEAGERPRLGAVLRVALGETLAASVRGLVRVVPTRPPDAPSIVRANLDRFKAEVTAERNGGWAASTMKTLVELEDLVDKLQLPNRNRPP